MDLNVCILTQILTFKMKQKFAEHLLRQAQRNNIPETIGKVLEEE